MEIVPSNPADALSTHPNIKPQAQRVRVTQTLSRDTSKLTVTGADDEYFIIMFEDKNNPGSFVESGLIKAGGSAADVTAAIAPYYRSVTGPDPDVTRSCKDDLGATADCSVTSRYTHSCPNTPSSLCTSCKDSNSDSTVDCLSPSADTCVGTQTAITDSTLVGATAWSQLKIDGAMTTTYDTTAFTEPELHLFNALKSAQTAQGDDFTLVTTDYTPEEVCVIVDNEITYDPIFEYIITVPRSQYSAPWNFA